MREQIRDKERLYSVGYDLIKEVIKTDIPVLKEQIERYLSEID